MQPEPIAVAFSDGCDARIDGQPEGSNPYSLVDNPTLRLAFKDGWNDVDLHWGEESKRPFALLPPVKKSRGRPRMVSGRALAGLA